MLATRMLIKNLPFILINKPIVTPFIFGCLFASILPGLCVCAIESEFENLFAVTLLQHCCFCINFRECPDGVDGNCV